MNPENHRSLQFAPPGHFYSPIPNLEQVQNNKGKIWKDTDSIPGVNLNREIQLEYLRKFKSFYGELPFPENKESDRRYCYINPAYSYSDAISLFCMMRAICPRRIVEVGSGYSSAAMMDVNELFFLNKIDICFIEPYPDLLYSLMKSGDREKYKVISTVLQDSDIGTFYELAENDILFIDSTHVSKVYSDVNRIFFEILPILKPGVYVHFHDVFFPFEYPEKWIMEGRAWNENYVLKAFLQFNESFEIVYFNSYLHDKFAGEFVNSMPLCLKNRGGHIWIRKIR